MPSTLYAAYTIRRNYAVQLNNMKNILFATLLTIVSVSGYSQNKSGVFHAVKVNDSATLVMCLNSGLKVNTTNFDGHTLLMEASRSGSYAAAKLLLSRGAKVNAKDQMGNTALMEAAWKGDVTMTSLLLQAGANTSLTNIAGETALSIATDFEKTAVVQLITGKDLNTKDGYVKQR